jgi:acetyltransferase-like isoleucine patch superfamily enzyme
VNFNGMKIRGGGQVIIGDNFHSGTGCQMIISFHNYEGAIVQAGCVVTADIPDCAIAGGSPAQVFKNRDKKHYYDLNRKGLFH